MFVFWKGFIRYGIINNLFDQLSVSGIDHNTENTGNIDNSHLTEDLSIIDFNTLSRFGESYNGEWKEDFPDGFGVSICEDGSVIICV